MDEKEFKAIKRVLKKLSALRQTMRKDDARILDSLVFGQEEVMLHSMQDQAQSRLVRGAQPRLQQRASSRASSKADPRMAEAASEVELHRMSVSDRASSRAQQRLSKKADPRMDQAASEVELHRMQQAQDTAVRGAQPRMSQASKRPAGRAAQRMDAATEVELHQMRVSERVSDKNSIANAFNLRLDAGGNYIVEQIDR
jgi:hypothetical protein